MRTFMHDLILEATPVLDGIDAELDQSHPRLPRFVGYAIGLSINVVLWGVLIWLV